jgi:hypothetical protein
MHRININFEIAWSLILFAVKILGEEWAVFMMHLIQFSALACHFLFHWLNSLAKLCSQTLTPWQWDTNIVYKITYNSPILYVLILIFHTSCSKVEGSNGVIALREGAALLFHCFLHWSHKYKASVARRIKPTSVLRAVNAVSVLVQMRQALKQ